MQEEKDPIEADLHNIKKFRQSLERGVLSETAVMQEMSACECMGR